MDGLQIYLWIALLGNALLSLTVAYAAKQKGRSAVGFFWLSFLTTFVIGILVVIAVPRRDPLNDLGSPSRTGKVITNASGMEVKCPYCAEWVKAEARVCKHCGRDIEEQVQAAIQAEEVARAEEADRRVEQELAQRAEGARIAEEKKARWKSFRKSARFKVLVGVIVALVGAGLTLGVVRIVWWFSFQDDIESVTSIEGSRERISNLGKEVFDSCGVPLANIGYGGSVVDDFTPWEYWYLELELEGLSSEQVDCASETMIGAPLSFWPGQFDTQMDFPGGYFIYWGDDNKVDLGWSSQDL